MEICEDYIPEWKCVTEIRFTHEHILEQTHKVNCYPFLLLSF